MATLMNSVNEMAYPQTFNMEEFKSLSTFIARVRYCDARLKKMASGSSRIVYEVDNEKVLKLAKNKKGLAQNECEANNTYLVKLGIAAEVFEFDDENYTFIEMEKAVKAKPSDFKRIIGYDFLTICQFMNYVKNWYTRSTYKQNCGKEELFDEIANDPYDYVDIFGELIDYLTNYQLESVGDLMRISSWGVVSRNGERKLVLIDYGLSDDIYDEYYR